jgi:hypothetical protein
LNGKRSPASRYTRVTITDLAKVVEGCHPREREREWARRRSKAR